MLRRSAYSLSLLMLASLPACAQLKKTGSPGTSAPQIIEATERRTRPGRAEMHPTTDYRFQIIWKEHTAPSSFNWKPDAKSWMDLNVARPIKRQGLGPGDFMIVEKNIDPKDVRYGDTLILT